MKNHGLRIGAALLTFTVGIFGAAFYFFNSSDKDSATHRVSEKLTNSAKAWETFLSFENQKLSPLENSRRTELSAALDELVRDDEGGFGSLRLISNISNANNQSFYILIGEDPLITIPGSCRLRIHLFDLDGKHLNYLSFNAGYRIGLKDIKVRYSSEIEREIIEVESEPVINGRNIAKQFYALIGTEILPIRLENDKQQTVLNIYESPDAAIGLNLSGHSAEAWKNSLKSKDTAELLASLLWLSGKHINPRQLPAYYNQFPYEDVKEAKLIQQLKADKEIKVIVQSLAESENKWLKDAANLIENKSGE